MKLKLSLQLIWKLPLLITFLLSCTELEFNDQNKPVVPNLSSRATLSKKFLDSTLMAEKSVTNTANIGTVPEAASVAGSQQSLAAATSVNYALQAAVSAQSTYPGYSVLKIKDGSRITTVGPSYSWANNYPDGTRLPQSVFLKFGSLKTINRIDIYTSLGYEIQNYTIQFRTTPTASWITLLSVVGNRSVYLSHTFSDVSLLEIQIVCQLGPPNQTIYARLNEVEIYGTAEPTLPSISTESGMLAFNSLADVDQAIAYLEYKYDQYSDAFAAQYPGLTGDQLADMEEIVGFNDDQPYINFESLYGISSLRAFLAAQEYNWLETTAGDETAGLDPDNLYMNDYEARALVNSNGYLKVGTLYYVFLSDDSYYTYVGGPIALTTIKKIKTGDPLPAGVKYFQSSQIVSFAAAGCRSNVGNHGFQYNSDRTWRYKWKVKAHDGIFSGPGKVKAVTKSYKKKNGHWKVRGAKISAQVFGDVVGQDCNGGGPVDSGPGDYKHKRKIKAKRSVTNLAVEKDQLHGLHNHEKVPGYISTLTW